MMLLKIKNVKLIFYKFLEFLKYIPTSNRVTTRYKLRTCRRHNQNAWNVFWKASSKKQNSWFPPRSQTPPPLLKFGRRLFGQVLPSKYIFSIHLSGQSTSFIQYFLSSPPICLSPFPSLPSCPHRQILMNFADIKHKVLE